jgi:hypothetical protein
MDMKQRIKIIGTIFKMNINGDFPKEAQYACCGHVSGAITKFYKLATVNFNDGTSKEILYYWGEQGGWHPSGYNSDDSERSIHLFELV